MKDKPVIDPRYLTDAAGPEEGDAEHEGLQSVGGADVR